MVSIALLTKKIIEVSPAIQLLQSPLTMLSKKKDSGGRACQPSEKVKQATHEQQETAQQCNAKAQRDHECCHLCLLMEEESENEDDKDDNRDEG